MHFALSTRKFRTNSLLVTIATVTVPIQLLFWIFAALTRFPSPPLKGTLKK
jgi:hypothetical protein